MNASTSYSLLQNRSAIWCAFVLSITDCSACISTEDAGALVPPTADLDPQIPQVQLVVAGRARAVHVETFGNPSSPPLLFLHGSLSDYRALLSFKILSDRYFVVFWDQRGSGLSERITRAEYTWDSIVEEIDAIRSRYAPDRKVTLLGHSYGAMFAALYASRHPERVEQLALLEPGGLNGDIFQKTYNQIIHVDLLDPKMNEMFWQNELLTPTTHARIDYRALMVLLNGRQTRYHCDPDHPPEYPVWRPGGYAEYLRALRSGATGRLGAPRFDFDFAAGLQSFPRKVLLLAGSCSALGPRFQEQYHVPLFREAEVVTIKDAGHRMFVEQFDAVLEALEAYLEP